MLRMAGRNPAERPARGADAEDVRLMARVALEDVRAFEQVYRRYYPRLARFLRGMLRQQAQRLVVAARLERQDATAHGRTSPASSPRKRCRA